MITTQIAANEIGCSVATVARWAARLGFSKRFGKSIILTKSQVNAIKKAWRKQAGNPNFGKSPRTAIAD